MDLEFQIKQKFLDLKTKSDFVKLINFVHNSINEESEIKDIQERTLNYYAFHSREKYTLFYIPKKSGGQRSILAPESYLKLIQRNINVILQSVFNPHDSSHGFLKSKSIVTNAATHVNKNYVFNLDLKDFFPNIHFRRIKKVLELEPFNLIEGEREEIGFLIANLCCREGILPQGAPTSPIITNIICQRLDRKLNQFAKENKARYSRYADDITFSSNNIFHTQEFVKRLELIISSEKFDINYSKVRIQDWNVRQEVTGLTVNDKTNISKQYLKTVRAMLNNWDKKGKAYAKEVFLEHFEQPRLRKKKPSFSKILKGKIEFIGMVKGKSDPVYIKYLQKYNSIVEMEVVQKKLSLWEKAGLSKVVDVYCN